AGDAKVEDDPFFLQKLRRDFDRPAKQKVLALFLHDDALALQDLVLAIADWRFSFTPLGVIERRLNPLPAGRPALCHPDVAPWTGAGRHDLDRLELLEIVSVPTPADEITLRVVIELLQARLHPLHFALALVELILIPVCQAGDDDFLALDDAFAVARE